MIFIDTHILVWLYQKNLDMISDKGLEKIESNEVFISPSVRLEIEHLYEIGRIKESSKIIVAFLSDRLGLKIEDSNFDRIIDCALDEKWTRDPFDRIITAHARLFKASLLTKDEKILKNYDKAFF